MRCLQTRHDRQNFLRVPFGFHVGENTGDFALVQYERRAQNAFAAVLAWAPYTEDIGDLVARVGQKWEIEAEFVAKGLMAGYVVRADAEDARLGLERRSRITKLFAFDGAPECRLSGKRTARWADRPLRRSPQWRPDRFVD
jgi:hypothetical protein